MSQIHQRNTSCCSFCREASHNIRGCNHNSIAVLYNKFRILFICASIFGQPEELLRNMYVNTLSEAFTLRELRAIAMRFARSRSDDTKVNYALHIWLHFFEIATAARQAQSVNPDIAQQEQVRYFNQTLADVEQVFPLDLQQQAVEDETDDFMPINLMPINLMPINLMPINLMPINLMPEFDAEALPLTKKYRINPILFCSETDEELEEVSECSICYEPVKLLDSVTLNCDHQFCGGCIKNLCQSVKKSHLNCPMCREQVCSFIVKSDELLDSVAENCFV